MTQTETIEVSKKEVPKTKIKVKNTSKGQRLVFDHTLKQHLLGPGQEAEIEVAEPEAKRMQEASKAGSDLAVDGHDAAEKKTERLEEAPEQPKEHEHRPDLAALERDELEAGAEADKERQEKIAKMRGEDVAAETGIHMYARGEKPAVKTEPPDAPPKKK
jgi:hypothetical protein